MTLVQAQETSCPNYREFDNSDPTAFQYNAPPGCKCVEGMTDLNCAYCLEDTPCQQSHGEQYQCREGMVFAAGDSYKSYQCNLVGPLESFFTGGKISLYANVSAGTIDLSLFNQETINFQHAADCHITGCTFPIGGANVDCALVVCNCTDYCSPLAETVLESLSGKSSTMTTEPRNNGTYLSIAMEGSLFDFEAICNASACSVDPNAIVNETLFSQQQTVHGAWTSTAIFALIVLCVLFGTSILLSLCIFLPVLSISGKTKNSKEPQSGQDHHPSLVPEDAGKHVLEFRNIRRVVSLTSDAAKAHGSRKKTILDNISGSVQSGTLMGIMGPSGSGKSSLLNLLAAVDHHGNKAQNSGQILLNGKVCKRGYRDHVACVHQDDALYGTLSVRECIEYSALLRLPSKTMSYHEKQARVSQTLRELRLDDIAANRIGTGAGAGISGGERKRVSIGMELVAHPAVILLDEPLSGLDSHAANQIMKVLQELLISHNRIVVLSIHQPSTKAFLAMDQIMVLGGGRVMYSGKPAHVERYLEDRGFPCPELETMADHLLDVVSDKANQGVLTGPIAVPPSDGPVHGHAEGHAETTVEDPYARSHPRERASILAEMAVLFGRTSKDIFRNRELFLMQMFLSTILACFGGAIFNNVSNNLAGFQNRMGVRTGSCGDAQVLSQTAHELLVHCRLSTFPFPSSPLLPLVLWISL
jgi:ATP-binding cassette, subfamily G (WHITE), member 2